MKVELFAKICEVQKGGHESTLIHPPLGLEMSLAYSKKSALQESPLKIFITSELFECGWMGDGGFPGSAPRDRPVSRSHRRQVEGLIGCNVSG